MLPAMGEWRQRLAGVGGVWLTTGGILLAVAIALHRGSGGLSPGQKIVALCGILLFVAGAYTLLAAYVGLPFPGRALLVLNEKLESERRDRADATQRQLASAVDRLASILERREEDQLFPQLTTHDPLPLPPSQESEGKD